MKEGKGGRERHTMHNLLYIVEDEVHELVVPLEDAVDFPPTAELDADFLIHVLGEVEDVFFLGFLGA